MEDFKLYLRYIAKYGNTFSEEELSGRGWKVAKILMQRVLEADGPAVTHKMIQEHLHSVHIGFIS